MRILVYGAGVIGMVYASHLHAAGHQVMLLARGDRAAHLAREGVKLLNARERHKHVARIPVCQRLLPQNEFDLVLVTVRRDQIDSVVPDLAANTGTKTILLLLNLPSGIQDVVDKIGSHRVILGFPGVGGWFDGDIVRYAFIRQQKTTLGVEDANDSRRVSELAAILQAVGFPVALENEMQAWLAAHAFFITAITGGLYQNRCSAKLLAANSASLLLIVDGVRDGFEAVRRLGMPVRPAALKVLFTTMPRWFAAGYWRRFLSSPDAETVLSRHALSAKSEMLSLVEDCQKNLRQAHVTSLALDALYRAITQST